MYIQYAHVGNALCISKDKYRGLMESFITWGNNNQLKLNIKRQKTKELVVGYQRNKRPPVLFIIQGEEVERVDSEGKKKQDWFHNTEALFRKGQSRLRCFSVCNRLLKLFYHSVVASVLGRWHQVQL